VNRVLLQRLEHTDHGTFGRISVDRKSWNMYSGELPWRDNKPNVSCIPPGIYECSWGYSPRFQRFAYRVEDVPGRSGILFHSANYMGDTSLGFKSELHGCIALGTMFGAFHGQKVILQSRDAVRRLETYFAEEPFILEIVDETTG
jgi:hypothetical protein